ncbi:phosphatidylserine/phosphatidylglycerophosphate/cardiolipin synthase family protein [Chlamydia sp.]|uniref:phospholipase D-like domain-containing protein n=1 Tax=Chlamydia sp. TaxID=35827 RepID=UPI0025C71334|nr:phosphatidylserine/phosphatidylglycerophosphate/cardiolipin synthase family protein [Chlamydia sp.]MBQ8498315.1 phosphatidylserine/phosphatidylglycerophosphate/cardiolipin synthase family protein [Chlamydia sp.]
MKISFLRNIFLFLACTATVHGFAQTLAIPNKNKAAKILVHDNGYEMYEHLLAAIDNARYTVELCPCMTGGEILATILRHLDQRMEDVPQLVGYMLIQPTLIDENDRKNLKTFKEKHGERFHYLFSDCPPYCNILSPNVIESHIKLSIVDGKYIFIGGTNLEDLMCSRGDFDLGVVDSPRAIVGGTRRPSAFRDQDVTIVSEELGALLRKEFCAHYALWKDFTKKFWFNKKLDDFRGIDPINLPLEKAKLSFCNMIEMNSCAVSVQLDKIRFIFSGPDETSNTITEEYTRLVNQARHSIRLAQMYFIPAEKIYDSLMDACWGRGVSIRVITNGRTDRSPTITRSYAWGNRINYFPLTFGSRPLLWKRFLFSPSHATKKFSVHEFYVANTQLHKKCMLVDDHIMVIGSYNFGKKSDVCDYECIVVIESEEVVAKAQAVFEKDLTLSKLVTGEEIINWYFDPVNYCLGHLEDKYMPA